MKHFLYSLVALVLSTGFSFGGDPVSFTITRAELTCNVDSDRPVPETLELIVDKSLSGRGS
jgi:hypothetical protein